MKRLTVAVAGLAVILSGCKMNVTPELYLSDLRAVLENDAEGLTTPTAIAVQVPSTKKCDEYTTKIGDVLTGVLDDYEARGCTSENMKSWLNLEAQVPVMHFLNVTETRVGDPSLPLFGVLVSPLDEGRFAGKVGVCLYVNREKHRLLNERMSDAFHQKIDLADSTMGVLLNNDEREPVTFSVGGTFLNGAPVFKWEQFSLERRHSAELEVSNVGAASLEAEGIVCHLVLAI